MFTRRLPSTCTASVFVAAARHLRVQVSCDYRGGPSEKRDDVGFEVLGWTRYEHRKSPVARLSLLKPSADMGHGWCDQGREEAAKAKECSAQAAGSAGSLGGRSGVKAEGVVA